MKNNIEIITIDTLIEKLVPSDTPPLDLSDEPCTISVYNNDEESKNDEKIKKLSKLYKKSDLENLIIEHLTRLQIPFKKSVLSKKKKEELIIEALDLKVPFDPIL